MVQGLTNAGLESIAQCTQLRSLALVWCTLVSDAARWSKIALELRHLRSLSVRKCGRIGDPILPQLLRTAAVHGNCDQMAIDAKATRITRRGKERHEASGGGIVILE